MLNRIEHNIKLHIDPYIVYCMKIKCICSINQGLIMYHVSIQKKNNYNKKLNCSHSNKKCYIYH